MISRSVATHDGPFHADEVTACALLYVYGKIDRDKIVRTRRRERIAECEYVCDVGGIYDPARRAFDHHQVDYQGSLSSVGMVWKYFRDIGVVNEDEYRHFNDMLIKGIDEHDNGKCSVPKGTCTFSHVISNFSPLAYEATPEEYEAAFQLALDFTITHLTRMREHFKRALTSRAEVESVMQASTTCLVFDRGLPWMESFFALGGAKHPAKFVIMPTGEGWKLRGIPPDEDDKMGVRLPLPAEWAGLMGPELQRVSGIPGAIFCHKGRFFSVWKTKDDALRALEYVMRNQHGHAI